MSPYADRYLDVKFASGVSGSITISVEEGKRHFQIFFLNILILCNPLYSANINHSSYYLRSVFVFRISTVASHFPCFWIHSSGAGSDCQQLGAILLQQFHGSWGSACHFDYSVSGIVPHTILGIKNLLI